MRKMKRMLASAIAVVMIASLCALPAEGNVVYAEENVQMAEDNGQDDAAVPTVEEPGESEKAEALETEPEKLPEPEVQPTEERRKEAVKVQTKEAAPAAKEVSDSQSVLHQPQLTSLSITNLEEGQSIDALNTPTTFTLNVGVKAPENCVVSGISVRFRNIERDIMTDFYEYRSEDDIWTPGEAGDSKNIQIRLNKFVPSGQWVIANVDIWAEDNFEDSNYWYDEETEQLNASGPENTEPFTDLDHAKFKVATCAEDNVAPKITSIEALDLQQIYYGYVKIPIKVGYEENAGGSGVKAVSFEMERANPNQCTIGMDGSYEEEKYVGTGTVDQNLYLENNSGTDATFTIEWVSIEDWSGNKRIYKWDSDQKKLIEETESGNPAKLDFNLVSVVVKLDFNAPEVTSVDLDLPDQIVTEDTVTAQIGYKELGSGIKELKVTYHNKNAWNKKVEFAYKNPEPESCVGEGKLPVKSGPIRTAGTYEITEIEVTDHAGETTYYGRDDDCGPGQLKNGRTGEKLTIADPVFDVWNKGDSKVTFDYFYVNDKGNDARKTIIKYVKTGTKFGDIAVDGKEWKPDSSYAGMAFQKWTMWNEQDQEMLDKPIIADTDITYFATYDKTLLCTRYRYDNASGESVEEITRQVYANDTKVSEIKEKMPDYKPQQEVYGGLNVKFATYIMDSGIDTPTIGQCAEAGIAFGYGDAQYDKDDKEQKIVPLVYKMLDANGNVRKVEKTIFVDPSITFGNMKTLLKENEPTSLYNKTDMKASGWKYSYEDYDGCKDTEEFFDFYYNSDIEAEEVYAGHTWITLQYESLDEKGQLKWDTDYALYQNDTTYAEIAEDGKKAKDAVALNQYKGYRVTGWDWVQEKDAGDYWETTDPVNKGYIQTMCFAPKAENCAVLYGIFAPGIRYDNYEIVKTELVEKGETLALPSEIGDRKEIQWMQSHWEDDDWITEVIHSITVKDSDSMMYVDGRSGVLDYTDSHMSHIWDEGKITKPATCTADGEKTFTCTECGETKTEVIKALGHTLEPTVTKATLTANGKIVDKCSRCGEVVSSKTIYYPKTISLSATSFTYNGKVQKPTVKVVGSDGKTINASGNYTVSYPSVKKDIGRYAVKVKFEGNYSGSKILYYTVGPKNTSSVSVSLDKYNAVKVTWKKVSGVSGYVIYYKKSTASGYTKLATAKSTATSYKKSNLAAGGKYTFKVVAYKKVGSYNCYNAGKTSSAIYTLKKIATPKAAKSGTKVKVSWTNIAGESGYQISQSTTKTGTKIISTYKTTTGKDKTVSAAKGKYYYYKVRAYRTVGSKKIYGPWSTAVKYKR